MTRSLGIGFVTERPNHPSSWDATCCGNVKFRTWLLGSICHRPGKPVAPAKSEAMIQFWIGQLGVIYGMN